MPNKIPSHKSPTIADVAKLAGVSSATVSRVVNQTAYVGPETIQKVQNAIDALNYRPSAAARILAGSKTETIGLLVPEISETFFIPLLRGIEQAAAQGRFQGELFSELKTVTVTIPPLRERKEDIPLIADQLLPVLCLHHGRPVEGFSERAVQRMLSYPWPGNVAELRCAIERAVILTHERTVKAEHIMVNSADEVLAAGAEDLTLAEMERRLIESTLERTAGNRSRTARRLGINRGTLYNKLRQYRIVAAFSEKEPEDDE